MYDVRNALIENWMDFAESNLQLIINMINDPIAKRSLREINVNQGKVQFFSGIYRMVFSAIIELHSVHSMGATLTINICNNVLILYR